MFFLRRYLKVRSHSCLITFHPASSTSSPAAPLRHCKPFEKAVNVLFPLAVCSTALLFFFRVRAVFNRNKWVVTFFTFMWLAVVAGCLSPISGVAGMNIGPTKYCIIASVQPYIATAAIIPLVNDTLVFLAISWRLMQNAHVDQDLKTGFRIFAFGEYMPGLSRALLQDGQAYYLYVSIFSDRSLLTLCSSRTTVTTSLLTVIMLYVDAVPVVYRTMFTVPNIVLMNVMACRVFRHTKFGLLRECEISTSSLLKSKAGRSKTLPATQVSVPLSALRFQPGPGFTDTRQVLETQVVDGTTTGDSQGDVSPDGTEVKYSPYCGDRIV